MRAREPFLAAVVVLLASAIPAAGSPRAEAGSGPPVALVIQPRAFAHNDEQHARPLLDALAYGFCSVEADVYLVNGQLLVAHDRGGEDVLRTLDSLYLRPLWERFQANGGHIYPEAAPFMLLIDVKNTGAETFRALDRKLADYDAMLTHFTDSSTAVGAVTVVISGDRARDVILGSTPRRAGIDGRLSDLDGPMNRHQMPLVSDDWTLHFRWRGQNEMPPEEAAELDRVVARAHERGMQIRFWATPQSAAFWGRLFDAGVDLLNADDLGGLSALLTQKRGR
jgi:hypothetical protein